MHTWSFRKCTVSIVFLLLWTVLEMGEAFRKSNVLEQKEFNLSELLFRRAWRSRVVLREGKKMLAVLSGFVNQHFSMGMFMAKEIMNLQLHFPMQLFCKLKKSNPSFDILFSVLPDWHFKPENRWLPCLFLFQPCCKLQVATLCKMFTRGYIFLSWIC